MDWFARQTGYSQEYLSRVKHSRVPLTAPFRARCSAILGIPESELFDPTDPNYIPASNAELCERVMEEVS